MQNHSVVSQEIVYVLTVACNDIGKGTRHEPDLHGDIHINPFTTDGAFDVKLDAKKVENNYLVKLLCRYTNRQSFFDTHNVKFVL